VRQHAHACAYNDQVFSARGRASGRERIAAHIQLAQQREPLQTASQPHAPYRIDAALAHIQHIEKRTVRRRVQEQAPAALSVLAGIILFA
jgi:hypothetical protein